jgi:hypothetical protein
MNLHLSWIKFSQAGHPTRSEAPSGVVWKRRTEISFRPTFPGLSVKQITLLQE